MNAFFIGDKNKGIFIPTIRQLFISLSLSQALSNSIVDHDVHFTVRGQASRHALLSLRCRETRDAYWKRKVVRGFGEDISRPRFGDSFGTRGRCKNPDELLPRVEDVLSIRFVRFSVEEIVPDKVWLGESGF